MTDPDDFSKNFPSSKTDSDLMKPRTKEDEEIIASFVTNVPKLIPLVPMSLNQNEVSSSENRVTDRQQFWIRLADTKERREQAALLVDRMYAWRGFSHDNIIRVTPHTITLVSSGRDGRIIGTVTIGMDSPEEKLLSEENYPDEIADLRGKGKKIVEFNALAVDSEIRSKLVIARLFHIAMLYPYGVFDYTDVVIEVNPAHVKFYQKMLLFDRLGDEKICPRVNAVGVLLHIEFAKAADRLARVGGLMEKATGDHSLYPYGFSPEDSKGILGRLRRMSHEGKFS